MVWLSLDSGTLALTGSLSNMPSRWNYDLSRNTSLRAIGITVRNLDAAMRTGDRSNSVAWFLGFLRARPLLPGLRLPRRVTLEDQPIPQLSEDGRSIEDRHTRPGSDRSARKRASFSGLSAGAVCGCLGSPWGVRVARVGGLCGAQLVWRGQTSGNIHPATDPPALPRGL